METAGIRDKIKEVIADVAGIEAAEIADNAHFLDDLNLDSLALLEMGVDIDYAFKLGAPDDVLKKLRTVQEAVDLVETFLAQKSAMSQVA